MDSKPIHEAVYFFDLLSPEQLNAYRVQYPALEAQLQPGQICGEETQSDPERAQGYRFAKAQIMVDALKAAAKVTQNASKTAAHRILWIRRTQVALEILVLIGSSSVIGSLTLGKDTTTATVAAIITLLSGFGSLLVGHASKLLNPEMGNIFDAHQNLHHLSWQTQALAQEISLLVQYQQDDDQLSALVAQGNAVMEQVNKWGAQFLANKPWLHTNDLHS